MQAQLFHLSQHYRQLIRTSALTLLFIGLTGCSIFHGPVKEPAQQAAQYLLQKMDKQQLASTGQLLPFIKDQKTLNSLPKQTRESIKKHPKIAANLLLAMHKGENPQQAAIQLIERQKKNQSHYIYVALTLFPVDGYRLAEKLAASDKIESDVITTASLRAGFDPALIFPATAANEQDYRIVPLMESASITLYNQTQNTQATIQFKAQGNSEWQPGLALQWEPIQGALSGSIVHLQPDTHYVVNVMLTENSVPLSEQEYTFKTRAKSPPIDPEKIYYLSDIYQGGQLNLEALGIEGSANGWAKIIGDGVTIDPAVKDLSAIHIGSQNYVMLENITTTGGERYGIHAYKAHHIWIKDCNISNYGRVATEYRNGKGYHSPSSSTPINYDSGIYLERSGVVVIEGCEIHSPNGKANSWEHGHPNGPNAFQIWGKHDTEAYRGQYIVRNNRFYGTAEHRFNDVIEGRSNFDRAGAFVRDSAIYNNYLAYANDDLIEIDGGQANVLVYNNEMTQGYCGISTAPNMIGPSYVFHNYIHDLGDERGKEWAAIKMGGIMSRPAGLTNVFENLIITNRNGIAASRVDSDSTFWVNARNNIIISRYHNNQVGFGIYDVEKYTGSTFSNNLIYNLSAQRPINDAIEDADFLHPDSDNFSIIAKILQADVNVRMAVRAEMQIPNFSRVYSGDSNAISNEADNNTNSYLFDVTKISAFADQDKYGTLKISEDANTISLTGNSWKKVPFSYTVTPDTRMKLTLSNQGTPEILGVALETDNSLSANRTFQLTGTQSWGIRDFSVEKNTTSTLTIPVGEHLSGYIEHLVFILDNDKNKESSATFQDISLYESNANRVSAIEGGVDINIGITSTP